MKKYFIRSSLLLKKLKAVRSVHTVVLIGIALSSISIDTALHSTIQEKQSSSIEAQIKRNLTIINRVYKKIAKTQTAASALLITGVVGITIAIVLASVAIAFLIPYIQEAKNQITQFQTLHKKPNSFLLPYLTTFPLPLHTLQYIH